MKQKETVDPSKLNGHLGKVGIAIMAMGLIVLYSDAFRLVQTVPSGYQYFEHPEIHVPIIGIAIAAAGTGVFIYNFLKGKKVF